MVELKKIYLKLFFICLLPVIGNAQSIYEVPEAIQIDQMQKPMVVEFYSPGCPHCRQMAPIYEKVANQFAAVINFYKVNITTPQGLTAANKIAHKNITGIPTFVFVDKNGKTSGGTAGGLSEKDLKSKIEQLQ